MMSSEPLLLEGTLSSAAFARDLTGLLSLSADELLGISGLVDDPEGFIGPSQAQNLSTRCGVPVAEAARHLRLSKFLYDRVTALEMDVAEATRQIEAAASELPDPLLLDREKREAIGSILSFKRSYEIGNTEGVALENAPHFVELNGSWGSSSCGFGMVR